MICSHHLTKALVAQQRWTILSIAYSSREMGHCTGGAGAWMLDGASQSLTLNENESDYSVIWSLVDWVAAGSGKAPD